MKPQNTDDDDDLYYPQKPTSVCRWDSCSVSAAAPQLPKCPRRNSEDEFNSYFLEDAMAWAELQEAQKLPQLVLWSRASTDRKQQQQRSRSRRPRYSPPRDLQRHSSFIESTRFQTQTSIQQECLRTEIINYNNGGNIL